MTGKSNCEVCQKEFKWRRMNSIKKLPSFCSKKCMSTQVHTWNHKNRFIWSKSSEKEKLDHLVSVYEKNVIKNEGCWDWKNVPHHSGYALLNFGENHKNLLAHRASWIIHFGEINDSQKVLHRCDNKKCTNPEHLFLGTLKDNTQDMLKKGRGNRAHGENHCHAKLNEEQVKKIKELLYLGVTVTRLSKDFNISSGAIQGIKNGITWKHVKLFKEIL